MGMKELEKNLGEAAAANVYLGFSKRRGCGLQAFQLVLPHFKIKKYK